MGNKETWRDWVAWGMPEPARLHSHAEVVAEARKRGVPVDAGELRYWEYAGILPRAVRWWDAGAVRAHYPDWMVDLAIKVRTLQHQGHSLATIRGMLRPEQHPLQPRRCPCCGQALAETAAAD